MPLTFNIITNYQNGYGLEDDYEIVRNLLQQYGHKVVPVQYDNPHDIMRAHINVFLEVVVPPLMGYATENWIIPNPEWYNHADVESLPRFKHILCKTQDAYKIFKNYREANSVFLGFENACYYMPEVEREFAFLHVAGQSVVKNTEAVIDAWQEYKISYPLTIIATKYQFYSKVASDRIRVFKDRIPENQYVQFLNQHLFHVCPSKYEGWGHSIHDARSVGAVVITTDAPPMNEYGFDEECLVPATIEGKMRLANLNLVKARDLAEVIFRVAARPREWLDFLGKRNRELFLSERDAFQFRFKQVIDDAERRLCGNLR